MKTIEVVATIIHQHELASDRCGGGEVLEGMIIKLFNCKPI